VSSTTDTGNVEPSSPDSALPSVAARLVAFISVFIGGAGGATIGYSFATLQCRTGGCQLSRGLFLWVGSLIGAIGLAVVATLTLRALGEWRSIQSTSTGGRSDDQTRRTRR